MTNTPKDRLPLLRKRVRQLRNTVEALKRDGHDCPDAERQLQRLTVELQAIQAKRPTNRNRPASVR